MLQKVFKKIKKNVNYFTHKGGDYKRLFESSIDGIYRSTPEGRYMEVNMALVNMLGYGSREELLKVNTKELYLSPDNRPSCDERDRIFTTYLKRKDGSRIFVEISSKVRYKEGIPVSYEGIVRDKTEYKKYEEKIKYLSFHDSLTGLHNRAYFSEEMKRFKQARKLPMTIIMADIDRLKYVNDTFGHETGDRLLKKAADIFRENFRSEDIIARTGGDEFCMILPGTSRDETLIIIQRIRIKCEFESSKEFPVSISFGAAEKKNPGEHLRNVLRDAERAMYREKGKRNMKMESSSTA